MLEAAGFAGRPPPDHPVSKPTKSSSSRAASSPKVRAAGAKPTAKAGAKSPPKPTPKKVAKKVVKKSSPKTTKAAKAVKPAAKPAGRAKTVKRGKVTRKSTPKAIDAAPATSLAAAAAIVPPVETVNVPAARPETFSPVPVVPRTPADDGPRDREAGTPEPTPPAVTSVAPAMPAHRTLYGRHRRPHQPARAPFTHAPIPATPPPRMPPPPADRPPPAPATAASTAPPHQSPAHPPPSHRPALPSPPRHPQHPPREQRPPQPPPPPAPAPVPFEVSGYLDLPRGGDARVRQFADGLIEEPDDPFVPPEILARYPLRPSAKVTVEVVVRKGGKRRRGPKRPKPVVERVLAIEGLPPDEYGGRKSFADLTPLDPAPRISLEYKGCPPACRLIDLFCPIGFGTRGLIVAPPKAGKTILLQNIAFGIKHNHPDVELVALLIDERPEEVTDFKRNVPAEVLASSNDQDLERHLALGILAIERAKRKVEAGKNVVVLLDSLTRLGRAFNNSRRFGSSGRTMSGGLDSRALEVPKQLFGAARRAEEGGSLTIIATCLVDTGSRADQVIFEEFKGTGNMELILDRQIAERRIFPAINLAASGTRKEHLLLDERELKTVTALRRRLMALPPPVQMEQLLNALQRFETNGQMVT
jgi:transcription termination factor Rho